MIFVGVGLTLAGCGTKKAEQTAPHPVYGVADLETLVKSHPKYSEYFRLETEYSHLVEKYKNEQQRIIRVASQQSKIRASVQDQSDRLAAENELKIRVKTKEDELNRKIQDLYSELSGKYKEKGVFSVDNLTAEERARMANLQMKLTVLGVRGDEKEQIKKELHELLSSRAFQGGYPMNGWLPEDVEKMNSAREKGSAELEKYADKQAAEIKADLDKKRAETMKTIGAEGILAAPEEFNAEWKDRMEAKQKEIAALKEKMMEDIRREAGRVASEKHLTMIFTQYRANISAEDVTGDIAGKIIAIDVQKVQQDSAKIQAIQKEITDKNAEIQNRLTTDSQAGLSDEDMQKKVQEAQQERMIFVQSKQKQIQSMVETQSAAVAKEKNIGIVMHKRVVPAGAVDITDEVLKKLNGVSDPSSTDKK